MAKSWRVASQYAGDVAACNRFPFSSKKPEMRKEMRFLNIEVVDDTALIDTSLFPKIKKPRSRSRSRRANRKIKKTCHSYSRAEMLALNVHVDDQRSTWSQVYAALSAPVAAEYDALLAKPPRPNPFFFANYGGGRASAMGKRSPL